MPNELRYLTGLRYLSTYTTSINYDAISGPCIGYNFQNLQGAVKCYHRKRDDVRAIDRIQRITGVMSTTP